MIDDVLLDCVYGKWCLDGNPYTGVTKTSCASKIWYKDGRYHKEDGPAFEWYDGAKEWCIHGRLHREDGPACLWANGCKEWFIHGERITTWKEYHVLSTLSPEQQVIIKLRYGEQLK